jgi:hypothetical protein
MLLYDIRIMHIIMHPLLYYSILLTVQITVVAMLLLASPTNERCNWS